RPLPDVANQVVQPARKVLKLVHGRILTASVRKLDACLLERAHDRLAGASTHPSTWPLGAVGVEHANPYAAVVVAFNPNVDVPLARVALEQVEHQQAWPLGDRLILLPNSCDSYRGG